ncbi:MAG TPA: phage portal protein, partial [Verrucomicrobiota bacterium]|nr:phage portal protein [Verrucomicrobiota bacterium]
KPCEVGVNLFHLRNLCSISTTGRNACATLKKIVQTSHGEKDFYLQMFHFNSVNMIKYLLESAVRTIKGKEQIPAKKTVPSATTPYFNAYGESATVQTNLTNPTRYGTWVYACVQRIAEGVAQVPFKVSRYSPNNERLIERGRLIDLLERPHPMLSRFDFFELIVSWLMVSGKAFIIALDEVGKPVSLERGLGSADEIKNLIIAPPDNFKRLMIDGELVGWKYRPKSGTKEISLLPEEVIYIRLPFVNDIWDGYSPLLVAALSAQTDVASAQYMKAIVSNNGETGLIVKTDQYLTDEQRAQIISALQSRKQGCGLPDRPIILESGLDIVKPSITSADLQFLENRKFNRQEICAVFGVPQEILGFTEDANRSVSETARLNFFENRIIPLCRRIEAGLKPLISAFNQEYVGWFDVEAVPIMQKRRFEMIETAERLWRMGVPFNDINRCFDLGFPYYQWHDIGYIDSSYQQTNGRSGRSSEKH